jgi:SOS-response transcriptional repressor LexA
MEPSEQRAALVALIAQSGESLASLSRLLGRNAAYLQQFVQRGTPRLLPEAHRQLLARYLGVAETALGGPDLPALVEVPQLDVRASAGPGGLVDREARRTALLDPALLRRLGVRAEAASIVRVSGDSMLHTLADGDEILVDTDRRALGPRGGLFVLRLDGTVVAKRLVPAGKQVDVISDNPAYPVVRRAGRGLDVVGQVVWLSRALI